MHRPPNPGNNTPPNGTPARRATGEVLRDLFVGPFRVDRLVRESERVDVYLAHHFATLAVREVALAAPPAAAEPPAVLAAVEEQLSAVRRLDHPGIARVESAGLTREGLVYISGARPRGLTLAAILRAAGPIPARQAVELGAQLAAALEAAHGAGLIHGDLTAEHVIIAPTTPVGSADPASASSAGPATIVGLGVAVALRALLPAGPPSKADQPYASPERVFGAAIDARSDVFSLASVLLNALSGVPPAGPRLSPGGTPRVVDAVSSAAGARRHVGGAPERSDDDGEPATLAHVLLRARAADPARRYPSAAAFRRALLSVAGTPERTRAVAPAPPASAAPGAAPGVSSARRWGERGAAGLGAAALVALLAFLVSRPPGGSAVSERPTGAGAPASRAGTVAGGGVRVVQPPNERAVPAVPRPGITRAELGAGALAPRLRRPPRATPRLVAAASAARTAPESPAAPSSGAEPRPAGDTLRAAEAAAREEAARLTAPASPGAAAPLPTAAPLPAAAVRAAVAEYARAIEARDLGALARAYPGITADQRRAWTAFFAAVEDLRARLAVEGLEPRGDAVHARVRGTYEYQNRRPNRAERSDVTFEAMFMRDSAGWRLRRVE